MNHGGKNSFAVGDAAKLATIVKKDDFNDIRIRCEDARIQIWVNDLQTVDYTETDEKNRPTRNHRFTNSWRCSSGSEL